jgi:hypothetical protein
VIELKTEDFKPEFVGKMGFYLAAVDDNLRGQPDEPSVGIILCRSRNQVVVEYALRYAEMPMGVATYRLAPQALRKELPTPEMLRRVLTEVKDGVTCWIVHQFSTGTPTPEESRKPTTENQPRHAI